MSTEPITSIAKLAHLTTSGNVDKTSATTSASDSFGQMLQNALSQLSQKENAANEMTTRLAAGEDIELHQVMLTMQETDMAFQLAMQVRNKLVEAYQEVMRMQV